MKMELGIKEGLKMDISMGLANTQPKMVAGLREISKMGKSLLHTK